MANPLLLIFAALAVLIALVLLWGALKKMLEWLVTLAINSVLGLIMLYVLNSLGLGIPINYVTLLAIAIFGLPAVAILAILSFFKMI
jgi:pro-sigmaK processing inhibitor BofA